MDVVAILHCCHPTTDFHFYNAILLLTSIFTIQSLYYRLGWLNEDKELVCVRPMRFEVDPDAVRRDTNEDAHSKDTNRGVDRGHRDHRRWNEPEDAICQRGQVSLTHCCQERHLRRPVDKQPDGALNRDAGGELQQLLRNVFVKPGNRVRQVLNSM